MKTIFILTSCFFLFLQIKAQVLFNELAGDDLDLYKEHIFYGQPDSIYSAVYLRNGYVVKFNLNYRIPDWVAYHITPEYLETPKRESKYKTFRTDKEIDKDLKSKNYTGSGYSRGHMAPYFAMGGDRDDNNIKAERSNNLHDPHDDLTVFQANFMTNMAPQDQNALNGPGGPWYKLETEIRTNLVKGRKMNLHVVVGNIIYDETDYKTLQGKYGDVGIAIPDAFFQILFYVNNKNEIIAGPFLFPHVTEPKDLPYKNLTEYMVSVDSIEHLTGLNFLNELSDEKQGKIENKINKELWKDLGL